MANKKTKRSTYGFTEKQLMKKAGVSRSSIQRFKRGDKMSDEMMKKIEKARRELLKQEARALKKEAMKRLKALQEARHWEGRNTLGPAGEYFVNELGLDILNAKGKSDEELIRAMGQVREFLNKKTSTVEGLKDWIKNLEKASDKTSKKNEGFEPEGGSFEADIDYDQIYDLNYDNFWEVYNNIRTMDGIPTKYFDKTGKFLSNQLQDDIRKAIIERTAAGEVVSAQTLINDVLSEARAQYEAGQKRQQNTNTNRMSGNM